MSILSQVSAASEMAKPLTRLLNQRCSLVGGIYHLDFHEATVLTDDFKKQQAGGIPEGGFLLAAAGKNTPEGFLLSDQEMLLLRVRNSAPLPNEPRSTDERSAVSVA